MAVGQDQLVFMMVDGERHYVRTVPDGQGEEALYQLFESDSRWIPVDDSTWILRDHVLSVRLIRSEGEA
jgi:hypothetical protein